MACIHSLASSLNSKLITFGIALFHRDHPELPCDALEKHWIFHPWVRLERSLLDTTRALVDAWG